LASSTPNPTPGSSGKPARSMFPLYLIIIISLAPFVLGTLAYYMPSLGMRPEGNTAYGTLLNPQRPMPTAAELPLTTLQDEPFDLQSLKGKWLLISADGAACPEACVRKLFILRNSHASQGKEVERIARVWFITDDQKVSDELLQAYRGTHMLRADPSQLVPFLAPQAGAGDLPGALTAPMWIIDPLGNLMMQFPADADPLEVRDDIRKLLKNSRIG
jgi:hypothetical protein